ncbi:MAG: hypothetical protein WAU33_00705 [Candidatus Binataceae bacterium]
MLYQQPIVSPVSGPVMLHAHQCPATVESIAVEVEFQVAGFERGLWGNVVLRRPVAAVPQLHGAPAILTLGNCAFEVAIIERMILNFDRKAFVMGID